MFDILPRDARIGISVAAEAVVPNRNHGWGPGLGYCYRPNGPLSERRQLGIWRMWGLDQSIRDGP